MPSVGAALDKDWQTHFAVVAPLYRGFVCAGYLAGGRSTVVSYVWQPDRMEALDADRRQPNWTLCRRKEPQLLDR